MNASFTGRFAVVTGASSGIGEAISVALADAGCGLCIVGRRKDRLSALAGRLPRNIDVQVVEADLAVASDLARVAAAVNERPGRLDLLVHAAGTIAEGPVETGSTAAFDAQFACNVRAPYLLTQSLLPHLRAARGQVVFLNSTTGLRGKAGVAAYSASKHALKGLADSLRDEVNADGVRVLSLYLGRTDTPMQQELSRVQGVPYDGSRFLRPEDVAAVLLPMLQLPASAEVTDLTLRPLRK